MPRIESKVKQLKDKLPSRRLVTGISTLTLAAALSPNAYADGPKTLRAKRMMSTATHKIAAKILRQYKEVARSGNGEVERSLDGRGRGTQIVVKKDVYDSAGGQGEYYLTTTMHKRDGKLDPSTASWFYMGQLYTPKVGDRESYRTVYEYQIGQTDGPDDFGAVRDKGSWVMTATHSNDSPFPDSLVHASMEVGTPERWSFNARTFRLLTQEANRELSDAQSYTTVPPYMPPSF